MEIKDINAIILRETKYKEADKILTLATDKLGKISAIAKGTQKITSSLGTLSLYSLLNIELKQINNEMYIITFAKKLIDFFEITKDLEAQAYLNYILNLSCDLFLESSPDLPLFELLANTVFLYSQNKKDKELIKSVFELRSMSMAGFSLLIDSCCECENPTVSCINIYDGDGYCINCGNKNNMHPINKEVMKAIKHITYSEKKSLFSFLLPPPLINELSQITSEYVKTCMEKEYSSLKYLRTIQKGLKNTL